jgi:N-carbamoylputrescine amidase
VLVVPFYEAASKGVNFNTAVVVERDGSLVGKYRKTHIPQVGPCFWEKFYFAPGDLGYPVFDTSVGKVGVSICYDRHFPEVGRALGMNGAELVFYPSATTDYSRHLWEVEQPAQAVANGYFAASINRVGVEAPLCQENFYGSSYIADPRGQILAMADDQEGFVTADLDMTMLDEWKRTWHFFRDRRPETYDDGLTPRRPVRA